MRLAALGSSEFIVGFQLVGITKIIEAADEPMFQINALKEDPDIGVVVVEESFLDKIDPLEREAIEDSVDPVFIPLSKEATQEGLRKLIKKSIGVDLWKDDNQGN